MKYYACDRCGMYFKTECELHGECGCCMDPIREVTEEEAMTGEWADGEDIPEYREDR
jgi:hypothetical protein